MSWAPVRWLLAAVALAALFMVVFERQQPAPARRLALDDAMADLGGMRVSVVTVAQGTSVVECVERQGRWYVARPAATRANAAVVRGMVEALEATRVRERISPQQMTARGLDAGRYGLDRPRLRISVRCGGALREWIFGADAPLGGLVFAQATGQSDVLAVTPDVLAALPADPGGWRSDAALPETLVAANRIEIKQPGGFMRLTLAEGGWRLQQPRNIKADDRGVERLLDGLRRLNVTSVGPSLSDVDLVAYGLGPDDNPPQVTVAAAGDEAGVSLALGKPVQEEPGQVYAMIGDLGALCRVPQAAMALLSISADDMRDRRIFTGSPAGVAALRLQDGDRRVELARERGGWRINEPVRGRADVLAVGQFVQALCGLESVGFPDTATSNGVPPAADGRCIVVSDRPFAPAGTNAGAARPAAVWTCRLSMEGTNGLAQVYIEEERARYRVKASDLARLLACAGGGDARLFADPLAFLDRTVLDLDPQSVRRLTLSYRGREEAVARDATGRWVAESPPESRVAEDAVQDILAAVAGLRAVRLETLSVTNALAFGLGESATRLTFSLSGEAGIQKTLILSTNAAAGGLYGTVQGQDAVFVLPAATAARLTRGLVVWQ